MSPPSQDQHRWTIVGLGAVGSTVAARLNLLGITPLGLGRSSPAGKRENTESLRFEGWGPPRELEIEWEVTGGSIDHGLKRNEEPTQQQRLGPGATGFFVCVKAYDLRQALNTVVDRAVQGAIVVPVTNGAIDGLVAEYAQAHPDLVWRTGIGLFGTTIESTGLRSLKSPSGFLTWGNPSDAWIGANQPTAEEDALEHSDRRKFFRFESEFWKSYREKWIYNTIMNSLCAWKGLNKNGLLLEDAPLLEAVFAETLDLYQKIWGPLHRRDEELRSGLYKLIEQTAENENSMHRDVRLGRKTETDFLAGMAKNYRGFELLKSMHEAL